MMMPISFFQLILANYTCILNHTNLTNFLDLGRTLEPGRAK